MRWDSLRLAEDPEPPAGTTRALFAQGAVTRTFDTPRFRGLTFHEIHAKSIINRVPGASRVPFSWTINPYRGCSHSCSYCCEGDTSILMADGRTRKLRDINVGDRIYGSTFDGKYRRYVHTTVLAKWGTEKLAYRVTLEDGTTLVASGDHRFLSNRGWKHVAGADRGPDCRPHLTTNNSLVGLGAFAEPPKDSGEYRRGYLCGMIRGDAHLKASNYRGIHYFFRLALVDREALDRTTEFLKDVWVDVTEFQFSQETETRKPLYAIRATNGLAYLSIKKIIAWPSAPSLDWRKGFLAGIFDAEGSYSQGVFRISNTDTDIVDWTHGSLDVLGFDTAVETSSINRKKPITILRIRGGLREALRFFHTTGPAITRKWDIEGRAIKSKSRLRVVSVEPLELILPMYDITTGTGDFIANGVVSHNCFARKTHEYLDFDAGHDFDSQIVVKVNAPELARKELAAPSWRGGHIAMGTNVDPYQRAEGKYALMPGIIRALRDAANPFSILTKGSLILRDLELLAEAAAVTDVGTNVSVGSVDRDLWRAVEPGTPGPVKRLEVCAKLTERGIGCGVLMAPILPYLSDSPGQIDATVAAIAAAGAAQVSPIVLHLRPGAREWYFAWLREHHPRLVPRYQELYARGAYAPKRYQETVAERVRDAARRHGVGRTGSGQARRITPPAPPPAPPAPEAEQLTLL